MNEKFENFCPEYLGQNFSNFFVHILGNVTTLYFHFEIYWPLVPNVKTLAGTIHLAPTTTLHFDTVLKTKYLVPRLFGGVLFRQNLRQYEKNQL